MKLSSDLKYFIQESLPLELLQTEQSLLNILMIMVMHRLLMAMLPMYLEYRQKLI